MENKNNNLIFQTINNFSKEGKSIIEKRDLEISAGIFSISMFIGGLSHFVSNYDLRSSSEIALIPLITGFAIKWYKDKSEINKLISRNEKELEIKEREKFVAKVVHELKNTISPMQGAIYLLEHKTESMDPPIGLLKMISNQTLRLTSDLLTLSEMKDEHFSLEKKSLELETVLNSIESHFQHIAQARKLNISFDVKNLQALPCVMADEDRLKQVFINLIGNAIKFTPNNGKIKIKTQIDNQNDEFITILFSIEDNGKGIDEEFLDKIFTPFIQSSTRPIIPKEKGVGLGLTIVKNLVETMDGKVLVKSKPGNGSTFFLHLPFEITNKKDEPQQD
ncbi:HAMP domain-containing histidine kinase [Candidatus Peregrinibacteria bacterium]|jgi:signal transduction histidine kinase|nr:HAMP domain-containing histidine kinase [Candidatus Peregrinibacteria bacterium]